MNLWHIRLFSWCVGNEKTLYAMHTPKQSRTPQFIRAHPQEHTQKYKPQTSARLDTAKPAFAVSLTIRIFLPRFSFFLGEMKLQFWKNNSESTSKAVGQTRGEGNSDDGGNDRSADCNNSISETMQSSSASLQWDWSPVRGNLEVPPPASRQPQRQPQHQHQEEITAAGTMKVVTTTMTTTTPNKQVFLDWVQKINAHDIEEVAEVFCRMADIYFQPDGAHMVLSGFCDEMRTVFRCFPDYRLTVVPRDDDYDDDVVVREVPLDDKDHDGTIVVARLVASGTHTGAPYAYGPYPEIPVSHRRIQNDVAYVCCCCCCLCSKVLKLLTSINLSSSYELQASHGDHSRR
jgi:hypothetical protein